MRRFIVVSLVLVLIYVLVSRSGLYRGVIDKVSETLAKGFKVLTSGATK